MPTLPQSFNQLLVPYFILFGAACIAMALLIKLRHEKVKQAQAQRLSKLKPPAKGRNHKSIPFRQYFLTQDMAKPTPADELLLQQWRRLHAQESNSSAQEKK